MNAIARIRTTMGRLAPLLLALFSSVLIAFGLAWSLRGLFHPLV